MSGRVLPGVLLMAAALSLVGAAATSNRSDEVDTLVELSSETISQPAVAEAADTGLPVRSGLLADQAVTSEQAQAPLPIGVRIGQINLDAPVLSVGVDEENRFDVPAADSVGWYKYSSLPGTAGATVLAAHVDYAGREGAFFNLRELRVGDRLEVEMSDGSVIQYRVTNNTQYDKSDLPADDLFRKQGDSVLQLITCGGTFNPDLRSYEANVVVSAEPIST